MRNIYLTNEEFKNLTSIDISDIEFKNLYRTCSKKINYYTFNRIDFEEPYQLELFKCCVVELIKFSKNINDLSSGKNKNITSETVDQHSISYSDTSDINKNAFEKPETFIYQTIKEYFAITGLMYRGV